MTAVLSPLQPRYAAWRLTAIAVAVAMVTTLLVYRGTAWGIVSVWERSATFAHGYAVIPIALWLAWRKRDQLLQTAPAPSALWLLPLAVSGALWLIGELAMVNAAAHLALVASIVFGIAALLGTAAARVMLFPLAFAFFAVPIGEFLMPPMIVWTADFTVWALRLSGIPVFRDGEQLVIPSGHWSVVEACSGIRYLISSVMVGALFAYLNYRSLRRRLLFMLVAIVVPIVANWVRAYLIVLTGHLSGNQLAVGADHLIYGWVFFGIVVAIMFTIGMRWAEREPAADGATPPTRADVGQPAPRRLVTVLLLVLAATVSPPGLLRLLDAGLSTATPELPASLPAPAGWAVTTQPFGDWKPAFQGSVAARQYGFVRADEPAVGLYVGYWRNQGEHQKLVSSGNVIADNDDPQWRRTARSTLRVETGAGPVDLRAETWRGSIFADSTEAPRMRTASVYWINGTLVVSAWQAKAWGGWHKLLGRGDDAVVLVFYTVAAPGLDADARLGQATAALLPGVLSMLRQARDEQ